MDRAGLMSLGPKLEYQTQRRDSRRRLDLISLAAENDEEMGGDETVREQGAGREGDY